MCGRIDTCSVLSRTGGVDCVMASTLVPVEPIIAVACHLPGWAQPVVISVHLLMLITVEQV